VISLLINLFAIDLIYDIDLVARVHLVSEVCSVARDSADSRCGEGQSGCRRCLTGHLPHWHDKRSMWPCIPRGCGHRGTSDRVGANCGGAERIGGEARRVRSCWWGTTD
jgi:hypothetical protein